MMVSSFRHSHVQEAFSAWTNWPRRDFEAEQGAPSDADGYQTLSKVCVIAVAIASRGTV